MATREPTVAHLVDGDARPSRGTALMAQRGAVLGEPHRHRVACVVDLVQREDQAWELVQLLGDRLAIGTVASGHRQAAGMQCVELGDQLINKKKIVPVDVVGDILPHQVDDRRRTLSDHAPLTP